MSDPITATLLIATTAISAGASFFGGRAEKDAADDRAELLQEQARLEREETAAEAQRKAEERQKFIAKQKVAFLANGIGLSGTPLVVLEDTFQQFNKDISSIQKSGEAKASLLEKEAGIEKKTGKAKLIGGVLGGAGKIAGNAFSGRLNKVF